MHEAAGVLIVSILVVLVYAYAGYPFLIWCLGAVRGKRVRVDESYVPRVALVIRARDRERVIRDKLENSLALDYPKDKLKIVVVSDGSADDTDMIVRRFESRGVTLKAFDACEGTSAALNRAVLGLEGDVLVFSDANACCRPDAIRKLVRNLADDEIGCVVGNLRFLDNRSPVGGGESLSRRYESFVDRLESALASVLAGTGAILALRRDLFTPLRGDIANDFQLPAEAAARGYGIVYEPEAVAVERASFLPREEFARKRCEVLRGLAGPGAARGDLGGRFRAFQYVSRKLIGWCAGPLLIAIYAANLTLLPHPFWLKFFVLQNAFYALALAGAVLRRKEVESSVLFIPFHYVMMVGAAFSAIVTYLLGGRAPSWEQAETTREPRGRRETPPRLRIIEGGKDPSALTHESSRKIEPIA